MFLSSSERRALQFLPPLKNLQEKVLFFLLTYSRCEYKCERLFALM